MIIIFARKKDLIYHEIMKLFIAPGYGYERNE